MDKNFTKQIEADLKKQKEAMDELKQEAEKCKQKGDMEAYWNLIAPGNKGLLYYLIGKEEEAQVCFTEGIRYLQEYEKWVVSRGETMGANPYDAELYLRAGLVDKARNIYNQIASEEDEAGKSMLGIALISTGAVDEGRNYLRWRVDNLDEGEANSPTRWYHLAECYLWLGEHQKASQYATRAVREWNTKNIDPPVLGFQHLMGYVLDRTPAKKLKVAQTLEAASQWFYQEDDIQHAFEAKEYIKLLDKIEKKQPLTGLKITGMSFM